MEQIRVGAISYLNTRPLMYGLKRHPVMEQIELIEGFPAHIARKLMADEVDIALIPVAVVPLLKESYIATDYCIGADGPVASVCLFSEVPIEEVTEVYLDYQSRTSVNLARVLLREYWKKDVKFIDALGEDFRQKLTGTTAGVVIGDRALEQRKRSTYIYDLAEVWIDHTGLPFVFATWIANKKLPERFLKQFNEANGVGLQEIQSVINENPYEVYDLNTYFNKNISYHLTADKRAGLALFLEKLGQLEK